MKQPPPLSLLTGRVVTIRVGSPPTDLFVHEEVLKTATESRFFQVAFTNGFKETETGVLELPEDDAQATQVLLHWIYGSVIGFDNCGKGGFLAALDISTIVKLYVLACKYSLNILHDTIMTYLLVLSSAKCWLEMGFTGEVLSYVEANTTSDCPLSKLLVNWITEQALQIPYGGEVKCVDIDHLSSTFEAMPERLVRAVVIQISGAGRDVKTILRGNSHVEIFREQRGPLCSYHVHGKGQPCPAPEPAKRNDCNHWDNDIWYGEWNLKKAQQ